MTPCSIGAISACRSVCVPSTRSDLSTTEPSGGDSTSALAKDADSRKERWHPSPQFINVLDPSGDIISREGLESIEAVVRIRMEAVMMVSSNHMFVSSAVQCTHHILSILHDC